MFLILIIFPLFLEKQFSILNSTFTCCPPERVLSFDNIIYSLLVSLTLRHWSLLTTNTFSSMFLFSLSPMIFCAIRWRKCSWLQLSWSEWHYLSLVIMMKDFVKSFAHSKLIFENWTRWTRNRANLFTFHIRYSWSFMLWRWRKS